MLVTCGVFLYSTSHRKLLLCHPTHSRWNNWTIPKGLKESEEQDYLVAVRELNEETGIALLTLKVLATIALPEQRYLKQNKLLRSFLIVIEDKLDSHRFVSNLVDGKDFPEVDKWKWFTIEEAREVIHETQKMNLDMIASEVARLG